MPTLPNPFYYLENFHTVLDWISERYDDLLVEAERKFIASFSLLPQNSRALLVRMVMRKGRLFRSAKLAYDEIGCPHAAAQALLQTGWVSTDQALSIDELFGLLKKDELAELLPAKACGKGARKGEILEALQALSPDAKPYAAWRPQCSERVYALALEVEDICEMLRLVFFGNLHQGWTEFVLAELGLFQYESVQMDQAMRGFQSREDVLAYRHLFRCRERFADGEPPAQILPDLEQEPASEWLRARRAKLLFQMGQHLEKSGDAEQALALYRDCSYPEARLRAIRILEKLGQTEEAFSLANDAAAAPTCDAERQHLERIVPRLRRKLGLPKLPPAPAPAIDEWRLVLPFPETPLAVEHLVQLHLDEPEGPVFYVENILVNALFGLLCWEVIFQPLPGAFFHPFHSGPADLHSADFFNRRQEGFAACFAQMESEAYQASIRRRYREKMGIQSPFVFWGALSEELLELALLCIPPAHLRCWFERLLEDIRANRTGFPDLVQFWPERRSYRMIEVKGPGDRLQDNQRRMLEFAHRHAIPVEVCYVSWEQAA